MAMNSLEKLLSVLQTGENEIKIDKNINQQAQRCGRVKPVHVYGTIFLISVYITGEHMTIRQAQRCGRVKPVLFVPVPCQNLDFHYHMS
jgi:fumarate hydratase class II